MYHHGYVISLTCDFGAHEIEHGKGCAEYRGADLQKALRAMRASGWKIYSVTKRAKCPDCVNKSAQATP